MCVHMCARTHTHTHTHTHTQSFGWGGGGGIDTAVKKMDRLKIVIQQVSLEREGRIRVAECLRQTVVLRF